MTTQSLPLRDTIPALACTLQGGYLIEASAGTGKTWTLTGIVLRLLIEKQYAPEKIIATTFTRAAAAEMQERIQARLANFYRYIHWIQSQKEEHPNWFVCGDMQQRQACINEIVAIATQIGIPEADDAINVHLIDYLLSSPNATALDMAVRRVSLLMATLDKLFVGTLDSLTQKWLKEFAAEISYEPNTTLSSHSDELVRSLIHDALRQEHYHIANSSPRVYHLLDTEIFTQIEPVFLAVKLALQFYTAPIDETLVIDDEFLRGLDDEIQTCVATDLSGFELYYDKDFVKSQGLNGRLNFVKYFGRLPYIVSLMAQHQSDFVAYVTDDDKKLLEALKDLHKPNLFNQGRETAKSAFFALPVAVLTQMDEMYRTLTTLTQLYQSHLYRKIAVEIRHTLKRQLESQNKSTFTFQMVRLNEALSNNPALARHIRHLYPVALIDESQDINGLQVELIEHIYLKSLLAQRANHVSRRGFLLLVGDPKQAIYRFRGGDVANYNLVKNYGKLLDAQGGQLSPPVLNQSLSLTVNRRSTSTLIKALNAWFVNNGLSGWNNHANLGQGIVYQPIEAVNMVSALSYPALSPSLLGQHSMTVLHFDATETDKYQKIAYHINTLLNSGLMIQKDGVQSPILPVDIAVLSKNKAELSLIKQHLDSLSIPSISPKDVNIFSTQAASDIYTLLLAVTDMADPKKVLAMLISPLFGISLEQGRSYQENDKLATKLAVYLKIARDKFYKQGVGSCLNFCLTTNPLHDHSGLPTLWENAAKQGERYLADLWQVIESVGRQTQLAHHAHHIQLMTWFKVMMTTEQVPEEYQQMVLPSESGVNLMTIHKSKGLEFAVVYVLGLDKATKSTPQEFYPYSDECYHRRLSANKGLGNDGDYYKQKNLSEQIDELRRLGYVALTRASEKTFVVVQDLTQARQMVERPIFAWFEILIKDKQKTIALPNRLLELVDWVSVSDEGDEAWQTNQYRQVTHKKITREYLPWQQIFAQTHFYGYVKTSATALMYQMDKRQVATYQDYDELDVQIVNQWMGDMMVHYPENDIRWQFEKGIHAGTFLHTVLQLIDPNDKIQISQVIDETIVSLGFAQSFGSERLLDRHAQLTQTQKTALCANHQRLMAWIESIVHLPMKLSGISISDLTCQHCAKEMGFMIGLGDGFSIHKLNEVLARHSDKPIELTEELEKVYYKYLKGEMDLVYEYHGRFYIVDYKSNYMGEFLSDYDEKSLMMMMDRTGYWLQACIYQVALHRLLALKIDDYVGKESQYLGGVEFIFLRGIDEQYPQFGRVTWQAPLELIMALDALFDSAES